MDTIETLRASACVTAIALSTPLFANDSAADAENTEILVVGQKEVPIEIEPRGLAASLGEEQFAAGALVQLSLARATRSPTVGELIEAGWRL